MPSDNPTATPTTEGSGSEPQALRRHVAAIADLGRKAVSGSPLEELFDEACALVAAALAVECVSLIEATDDELMLRAAAGWPDFDIVGMRAPRSLRTQAAYTLDVDETVVLVDPAEETRFEVSAVLLEYGIASGVSVPIRGLGRAFGVLMARTREPRLFSEDDTVFLRLVANVVAAAVESERVVSAQRATQAALEESELLFRSAFDDAPAGMLLTNVAGDVIRVNAAFARMVRYEAADLAGRTVSDIIHPDDLVRAARHIDEMTAGLKDTFVTEERFVRSDGEIAWGQVGISAVRSSNGMPLYFVAQVEDITELRRMQTELRESEALHSAVVESSRDLITVLDPDGTIRLISRSVREILGYTQEDLVGTNFADLAHADDFAAAAGALAAATRGEDPLIAQVRVVAKNGGIRMLEGKVSAVFDPAGNPTLLVTNSRDVTERISLEEQLRQSQKMEAIGMLAGGVAHDFNNLLTAINGYSDLALESLPPEEGELRHSLEEIRRAGERAAELTRQLLAFSRQQVLRPEPVELSAIIEGYLAIFERLVGEDITVHTKLDPKLPTVNADPGQLGQVLLNLVVNARDAMPDGGELRIETATVEIDLHPENLAGASTAARYVTLTVSDTGLGMDELTKQRVFEPFFTTKPPGKGTGMGLSTVHGIVQQSGGTIVVRSKPNQGASFRVYFPVAGQAAATHAAEPSAAGRGGDDATILVVEDEPLVRGIMQEMLKSLGYRVLAAESPHEAIAIAESAEAFDLVLTDVVMPQMNGHELALRLVELRPGVPILYTSGYTGEVVETRGVLDARDMFLQKPFTIAALAAKVRAGLAGPIAA